LASYRSGSGQINANIAGAGSISKSFRTSEIAIDVRWLMRQYSSSRWMPYALLGLTLRSNTGTQDELEFQDTYSQKDRILLLGAGAIIPLSEKFGFHIDGKIGANNQQSSGNYVASPGVTLSFNSYSYTTTTSFFSVAGSIHYNVTEDWNAQFGAKYDNYSGGTSDTGIYAKFGYAYR
jgi:hypothetical protein